MATGVQRAKRRDSRTKDRCWPVLTSLKGLSAHTLWWVGAGASEVRSQGEDWGWLSEHSLKGASAPQLAGRESGNMSGPAREAKNHCFRVLKEREFLLHVPTDGRALPKWAPETGMSHSYQLGPKGRVWDTNTATAATKNPVWNCRSLPTPPWESVQPGTARVPWSRDNFPGRAHSVSQAVAMSCWPLPTRAHPAFQLWLPYPSPPQPEWAKEF